MHLDFNQIIENHSIDERENIVLKKPMHPQMHRSKLNVACVCVCVSVRCLTFRAIEMVYFDTISLHCNA